MNVSGEAPTSYTKRSNSEVETTELASSAPKVLIMNRCTGVDFFYACILAQEVNHSGHVKAILQRDVRFLPLVGPVLSWFRFLSLKGDKVHDQYLIEAYMERLGKTKSEWLVFFPESRHINAQSLRRSKEAAHENGRPELNNLLLPHADMLSSCLEHINNEETEIYDMTLLFEGYSGEVPDRDVFQRERDVNIPNLMKLLMNTATNKIHLDSRLWKLKDVVDYEGGIQGWLDDCWVRKDALLEHFKTHQNFPVDSRLRDVFTSRGSIREMFVLWAITGGTALGLIILSVILALLRR